jgi:iron(III) transport system substrate-binding protein
MPVRTRRWVGAFVLLAAAVALVEIPALWSAPPLVVYCAHDQVFADGILREFEKQTGIRVVVRYDAEATKSLGFVNMLIQEKDHPQCDVFWNNELLGTCELAEQGVLTPYRGPGFERIPERFKDAEGRWAGFAARLRVYIVNTDRFPADEAKVDKVLAESPDLTRVAIAQPLFGTTLTQYTLAWHVRGEDTLKTWHRDVRQRGIREVPGNAATKKLVAEGACDFAFTDTDDFFAARDEGKPVAALPVRIGGQTVCIPNSVAIIRGTRQLAAAQKLVDYLLSVETELKLAKSESRQIPLGAVADDDLPQDVRPLVAWGAEGADLRPLLTARREVVRWLKLESLR